MTRQPHARRVYLPPERPEERVCWGDILGLPGGDKEEEAMSTDDETAPGVLTPIPARARFARRLSLDVAPPPCESCVHEPVCALRAALEGLADVEASAPRLPDGLSLSLAATVRCDHYLRNRAGVGGRATAAAREWNGGAFDKPKRVTSPETREKQRQGALAANARRKGAATA